MPHDSLFVVNHIGILMFSTLRAQNILHFFKHWSDFRIFRSSFFFFFSGHFEHLFQSLSE